MPISEQTESEVLPSSERIKTPEDAQIEPKNTLEQVQGQVIELADKAKERARVAEKTPELSATKQATEIAIDHAKQRASLRVGEVVGEQKSRGEFTETEPISGIRRTLREGFKPTGDLGEDFDKQFDAVLDKAEADGQAKKAVKQESVQKAKQAEVRNWQNIDEQIERVFDAKAEEAVKLDKRNLEKANGQRIAEKLAERPTVSGVKKRLKEGDILGAMEMSDLIDSDFGRSLAYRDLAYNFIDKGDLKAAKEMAARISDERSRFGLEQQLAQLERDKKLQQAAKETKGPVDTAEVDEDWNAGVAKPPENLPRPTQTLEMPTLRQQQRNTLVLNTDKLRADKPSTRTVRIAEQTSAENQKAVFKSPVKEAALAGVAAAVLSQAEKAPNGTVRIAEEVRPTGTARTSEQERGPSGTLRLNNSEAGPTGTVRIGEVENGPTGTLRIENKVLSDFERAEKELIAKRDNIRSRHYFEWGDEYEESGMTKEEWSNLVDSEQKRFQGLQYEAAEYGVRLFGLNEKLRQTEALIYKDRLAGKEPSQGLLHNKRELLQQIRDIETLAMASDNEVKKLRIEARKRMPKTPDGSVFAAGAVAAGAAAEAYRQAPERVQNSENTVSESGIDQGQSQIHVEQPPVVAQNINIAPSNAVKKKKSRLRSVGAHGSTGGISVVGWAGNKALGAAKGITKAVFALPNYLFKADLGDGLVGIFDNGQKKIMDWMDNLYKKQDSK